MNVAGLMESLQVDVTSRRSVPFLDELATAHDDSGACECCVCRRRSDGDGLPRQ